MPSYFEYYRKRLDEQTNRLQKENITFPNTIPNITGKKRKYEDAMGYPNDYLVVQDPKSIEVNKGSNWTDSYLENLSNNKNI